MGVLVEDEIRHQDIFLTSFEFWQLFCLLEGTFYDLTVRASRKIQKTKRVVWFGRNFTVLCNALFC